MLLRDKESKSRDYFGPILCHLSRFLPLQPRPKIQNLRLGPLPFKSDLNCVCTQQNPSKSYKIKTINR